MLSAKLTPAVFAKSRTRIHQTYGHDRLDKLAVAIALW